LTVENSLFKSFDRIVRKQLEPDWINVGFKTRQLINDLRVLRELCDNLLRLDCISYQRYLENLSKTEDFGFQATWIFTSAASRIFETARNRVFLQKKNLPKQITRPKKKRKTENNESPMASNEDEKENAINGSTSETNKPAVEIIKIFRRKSKMAASS